MFADSFMHSFYAFIDEAGDEGFVFKDPPQRASSEWFVLSAVIFHTEDQAGTSRVFKETLDPIEQHRRSPLHFRVLPHEARIPVVAKLAALPISVISICVNKKSLGPTTLENSRRLYYYCTRFLLERITWLVRDHPKREIGDGKCLITFSRSKRLSYENMASYLELLAKQRTEIAWVRLAPKICVKDHTQSIWLRAADAVASSTFRALELNEYGFTESRYICILKPVVYCRSSKYLSYGLKLFPSVPDVQPEHNNRYDWLDIYK